MKPEIIKNKKWAEQDLEYWKNKQKELNPIYEAASKQQLAEWVKGNNIHNEHDRVVSVVDENDIVVGYHLLKGPECCPDFSCCGAKGFTLEERECFVEFRHSGNAPATQHMLTAALSEVLVNNTKEEVYVTGQINEPFH